MELALPRKVSTRASRPLGLSWATFQSRLSKTGSDYTACGRGGKQLKQKSAPAPRLCRRGAGALRGARKTWLLFLSGVPHRCDRARVLRTHAQDLKCQAQVISPGRV